MMCTVYPRAYNDFRETSAFTIPDGDVFLPSLLIRSGKFCSWYPAVSGGKLPHRVTITGSPGSSLELRTITFGINPQKSKYPFTIL